MWIVRLALRRPYTFVVMSILIFGMGFFAIFRTPADIFPNINIPVISIIWNYAGLVPRHMNNRITYITERALTTTASPSSKFFSSPPPTRLIPPDETASPGARRSLAPAFRRQDSPPPAPARFSPPPPRKSHSDWH